MPGIEFEWSQNSKKIIKYIHVYIFISGVYLPSLWERGFCWKSPLTLGYTRGHFSALVTMEMPTDETICAGADADVDNPEDDQVAYLPLVDKDGHLLPIHFLRKSEVNVCGCIIGYYNNLF